MGVCVNNCMWHVFLMLSDHKTAKKGTKSGMQFSCLIVGGAGNPKVFSYNSAAAESLLWSVKS